MRRLNETRCTATLMILLTLLAMARSVHADPLQIANELRARGCGSHATGVAVKLDPQISAIAEQWSRGGRLARSIPRGYGEREFASLHVSGARNEKMLTDALRGQFCTSLADPKFTRLGVFRDRDDYWMVLASAITSPRAADADAIRTEALRLVNAARARERRCGTHSFSPAPLLQLDPLLNRAAKTHARNMAQHQRLQHEGFDGSTPGDRATAAGYSWRAIGENIAAGPTTAAEVVQMWLDSPGHCANIMSPSFTQMGLAFAEDRAQQPGVYWAQEFGRPR